MKASPAEQTVMSLTLKAPARKASVGKLAVANHVSRSVSFTDVSHAAAGHGSGAAPSASESHALRGWCWG